MENKSGLKFGIVLLIRTKMEHFPSMPGASERSDLSLLGPALRGEFKDGARAPPLGRIECIQKGDNLLKVSLIWSNPRRFSPCPFQ